MFSYKKMLSKWRRFPRAVVGGQGGEFTRKWLSGIEHESWVSSTEKWDV